MIHSLFLAEGEAGNPLGMFLPLILMFAIMYFMLIRPQKRRQMELQKQIDALRSGDKIITASGIHGLVTNVKKRTVLLKIAENVKIEIEKAAVATILSKSEEPEDEEEEAAEVEVEAEDEPKSSEK